MITILLLRIGGQCTRREREMYLFVFLFPDCRLHCGYISSDLDIIMIFYQTPAHHDAITGERERETERESERLR